MFWGIIEVPINYELDNLKGYEVWGKKKFQDHCFILLKKKVK